MKLKTSLPTAFLLLVAATGFAQGVSAASPLLLEVTPAASFPLGSSGAQFSAGSLIELSGLVRMPFLPLLLIGGDFGYGNLPLKAASSVSLLSAGADFGVDLSLTPGLSMTARVAGGYYWSHLADSAIQTGGGNPYIYGGIGMEASLNSDLGIGLEFGYRNYFGVYQGLEASLGARVHMGGTGWSDRVQSAMGGAQPLALEVIPAASIPIGGSGATFSTGSLLQLSGAYHFSFFPPAFVNAELGVGSLPLKASGSLSVLSGGAGAGVEFALLPWLSVNARGAGGYYYGYLADSPIQSGGGNPYLYGGAGLDIAASSALSIGFEVGYRDYIGVYQGLETALGARIHLGSDAWAKSVQTASASAQPLSFTVTPAALIPIASSASQFETGSLVEVAGTVHLPFLPILSLSGELGYGGLPLKATSSLSVLSAGAGVGADFSLLPWLSVNARGSGGYYFGYLANSPIQSGGGNPYLYGGAGFELALSPALGLGFQVGYRDYFGVYQGLEAALTSRLVLGGTAQESTPGTTQPQNLPTRPEPLTNTGGPLTASPGTGLELSKADVQDIYPVFYKFYDDHAIGTAVLHNFSKAAVQNVKVSVFVKEYMDNPKEVAGPATVKPGSDVNVDLFGLFKKNILANTESTKVSANISLSYSLNGKTYASSTVQTITVLKRNALTWDDDRKAAAFVSPNDPTAVRFAKNVAAAVNGKGNTSVEPNLRLAAAIHDALNLYGITYTSDPVATLNSDNKTVDYIQFPQQTLDYRSGKCSDFSALYASMFEADGLETAFITIPGHIYMAVALTLSPEEARAAFTHKDDLIITADKVWLPIEITLRDTFVKAWQLGAKEWRENLAKNQAKLYPLHDAWKVYEPVGYSDAATTTVSIPADDKIQVAFNADIDAFVKGEMGQQEVALLAAVTKASTTAAKEKATNSLAILHSRFGLYDQAIKEFGQVIAKDEYVPALINLGNIYFLQGDNEKALVYYNRAQAKAPKNPVVLLCVARANHALENYSIAKKAYADLQAADPNLASRFAYLDLRGEEATRAADASGTKNVVVWQDQ